MLLLALSLTAAAQGGAALERAVDAAAQARASDQIAHPDQSLWREAIRLAEAARAEAPEDAATLEFAARLYDEVAWYVRSWQAWLAWQQAAGQPLADPGFAEAGHQLGFARYQLGDLAGARPYYERVLAEQPDNAAALHWLARISLEQGDLEAAAAYLEEQLRRDPGNAEARARFAQVQDAGVHGPQAAAAFATGVSLYEQGDFAGALTQFETALGASPTYVEAAVWAGRTAQEIGQPQRAEAHWLRAVELDPADERSNWFLQLARTQNRWGLDAANHFYEGQGRYAAGDVAGALASFEAAVRANSRYVEAIAWSGRAAQELGRWRDAERHWEAVLAIDPTDEGARYFLRIAQQQLAFGTAANQAFLTGLAAYQQADLAAAETGFRRSTETDPEFAPAWGYLGQLYLSQGRFTEAAEAFERAREIEPANDEYVFFAMEARRLADSAE